MLNKIELLVGGCCPEIIPLYGLCLLRDLAFSIDNGGAALLAEGGDW